MQVAWSNAEDLNYGFKRPPTHHIVRAHVDNDGMIAGLEHDFACPHSDVWPDIVRLRKLTGVDMIMMFGAHVLYDRIRNCRVRHYPTPLPLPLAPNVPVGRFW